VSGKKEREAKPTESSPAPAMRRRKRGGKRGQGEKGKVEVRLREIWGKRRKKIRGF